MMSGLIARKLVVAEPELVDHAGGEVVGDDVAVRDQVVGELDGLGLGAGSSRMLRLPWLYWLK